MSSLEKCLFRSFSHFLIVFFVFLALSYMSCLYILEINPLPVVSLTIIFSHSEGCLFTLLIVVSFAVQKLLSLIRSHFLFPLFQEVGHRRSCYDLCHQVFCLCFPLRVLQFLVLHLGLQPILSLAMCTVLGSVLISFVCTQLSSFPITTC